MLRVRAHARMYVRTPTAVQYRAASPCVRESIMTFLPTYLSYVVYSSD